MTIDTYQSLLRSLPVFQQSFTTKRSNWTNAERSIKWLEESNDLIFQGKPFLKISREDILSHDGPTKVLIIKTIYWGYPNGMRGNHFVNILNNIATLEDALDSVKLKTGPSREDFESLLNAFDRVPGLGMSTFSKILYFMGIRFNGDPSLILDKRLIDIFRSGSFTDFYELRSIRYENTRKHYLPYLRIMSQLAERLGTRGESIEQFLFIFGNNLKSN